MANTKYPRPQLFDFEGLDAKGLDLLEAFMTHYMANAHRAYTAAAYAAKLEAEGDMFKQNRDYWKNVHSGLRWVRGCFRRSRAAHERRTTASGTDGSAAAGSAID